MVFQQIRCCVCFFSILRLTPRSTPLYSSAASYGYKRQATTSVCICDVCIVCDKALFQKAHLPYCIASCRRIPRVVAVVVGLPVGLRSTSEPSQNKTVPSSPAPAAQAAPAAKPAGAGKAVTSPLPGVIIEVSVKEGQAVKAGQKVAVIEAMKMENEIQAETDGTVTAVLVSKGDSVLEGAEIVKIA